MGRPLQFKVVRVPGWMSRGIDIRPFVENALASITREQKARHDRAKGLGVRNNVMNEQRSVALQRRLTSTRNSPRHSGRAWRDKQGSRFRGMAPRVIKKYILEPLRERWAA
jgi:hypothetical protein